MNKLRSNEKRQLKKIFEYRKNYIDPSFPLGKESKNSLRALSRWNRVFRNGIKASLPYSEKECNELSGKDYYQYVKIAHMVGLFHKENSYWFRDKAIDFLVQLYDKWQRLIEKLDQEYLLKIWVFESDFLESQLVFALNNRMNRYAKMFDDSGENREIPFISSNLQKKISTFDVAFRKEFQGYSLDDLDEMPSKVLLKISKAPLIRKGLLEININDPVSINIQYFLEKQILEERESDDGELYYIAHTENVWVLGK